MLRRAAHIQQDEIRPGFEPLLDFAGRQAVQQAIQLVAGDVGRQDKVVQGGRIRRRVAEVHLRQLVHRHSRRDRHRRHVHALVARARPHRLGAQELARALVHHQLEDHRPGRRHVVGPVRIRHQHRDGGIAALPGGGLGQARPRHAEVKDLADRAAQHAREPVLPAADVDGGHAALLVGRRAHGHVAGLARDEVGAFRAIARRVDIRVRGAQSGIHPQRAGGADLQPGLPGQFHIRLHADAQDHQVRGQPPAVRHDSRHLPRPFERLDLGMGHHLDAVSFHVLLHQPRHFPIQHAQNLRQPFHHRHPAAALHQRLDGFHANQAAADHHHVPPVVPGEPGLDGIRVRHAVQGEDVGQRCVGDGGDDGAGPGGQHQLVVIQPEILRRAIAAGADALARAVYLQGLRFRQDFDVLHLLKERRVAPDSDRRAHQVFLFLHHSRDVIGQAAAGKGDELSLLQQGHFGGGIQPHNLRGGFGAGGHAADDNNFQWHKNGKSIPPTTSANQP